MSQISKQLKSLKQIYPSESWLKQTKSQLQGRFFIDGEMGLPKWEMLMIKVAGLAMLVLLVTGGTFTAVGAAQNSLPGGLMYPLKLAIEKVQIKLPGTEGSRADLRTEFASRRLRELSQLTGSGQRTEVPQNEKQIRQVVSDFRKEISGVSQYLNKAKEETSNQALAVAQQVNLETSKYEGALAAANKQLSSLLQQEVEAAIESVEETKVVSLKVMIENVTPSDPEVTATVSKQLTVKIQQTEEQISQVKDEAAKLTLSESIADAGNLVSSEQSVTSLAKTNEAVQKLDEAKQELAKLNLLAALEKAEDSRRLINEAEILVSQANTSANTDNAASDERVGTNDDSETTTATTTDKAAELNNL